MERRSFLKQAAAVVAGMSVGDVGAQTTLEGAAAHTPLPAVSTVNGIGRRKLGRADVEVSILGIGGHHIGRTYVSEADGIRIIQRALDEGINFLDNCWDYNNGVSEERMGKVVSQLLSNQKFVSGVQTIVSSALSAKGTLDKSLKKALSAMNLPSTDDVEQLRKKIDELESLVEGVSEKVGKLSGKDRSNGKSSSASSQ